FREKEGPRKLLIDQAEKYKIDVSFYNAIKQGKDVVLDDGTRIPNHKLTGPPPPPKSYAFCSDTAYQPEMADQLSGVDCLYHESTFQQDRADLCEVTKHSTAEQAAKIARRAGVGKLILGHYSSRYKTLDGFKTEAKAVFEQVELAEDGKIFKW